MRESQRMVYMNRAAVNMHMRMESSDATERRYHSKNIQYTVRECMQPRAGSGKHSWEQKGLGAKHEWWEQQNTSQWLPMALSVSVISQQIRGFESLRSHWSTRAIFSGLNQAGLLSMLPLSCSILALCALSITSRSSTAGVKRQIGGPLFPRVSFPKWCFWVLVH